MRLAKQGGLLGGHKRQHHRHGVIPPVQRPQIGLVHIEVASGQVHACQHVANQRAVRGGGCQFAFPPQSVHHGRRLAIERVHDIAIAVGGGVGNGYAMVGQVLHQPQVKRQLLGAQTLEQGEYIGGPVGGDEVVGVFYAARAARHGLQGAQLQVLKKMRGLVKRDLCVNRHVSVSPNSVDVNCRQAKCGHD